MPERQKPIDWTDDHYRQMLIYQRRFMWHQDTLDRYADWLDLHPGMTVADIGCGLGYMGFTYWRYCGENGKYIGIDNQPKLLEDARQQAKEWAIGGEAEFYEGDAYDLPLANESVDCAMCQTLLMHLERPRDALAEMVRVVKPGGIILCHEPDNLSSSLQHRFNSLPDIDIDDEVFCHKIQLVCRLGRIKIGRGDCSIGAQIPHLMSGLGLIDIDIRNNDVVFLLEPPYDNPVQQHRYSSMKKHVVSDNARQHELDTLRKEFIAGGGEPADFERYIQICDRVLVTLREQTDQGKFFTCGGYFYYICKGRKPA